MEEQLNKPIAPPSSPLMLVITAVEPEVKRTERFAWSMTRMQEQYERLQEQYEQLLQSVEASSESGAEIALNNTPPLTERFWLTTGPVSQSYRRSTGGPPFWQEDLELQVLRTKPLRDRSGNGIYTAYGPAAGPQSENRFDPDAENKKKEYLKDAWNDVTQMGPAEADWFDLIIAKHLKGWKERSRDKPISWAIIYLDDLKRARTKGIFHGFRDARERDEHHGALRRLLNTKYVWENVAQRYGKERGEIIPYFESVAGFQRGADGARSIYGYRAFPTHWFDVEMATDGGGTPMYFEAALKVVIQIPPNKQIAKAIARYAVAGFWRQRASDYLTRVEEGRGYNILLIDLLDRAGVPVPAWAKSRPTQFAENVLDQIDYLCHDDGGECLLAVPRLNMPTGKNNALERFLSQDISLLPHENAPLPLRMAILRLEKRGEMALRRLVKP